jgi:PKHD-type hydroxylase
MTAWLLNVDKTENWAYWDEVFTPDECRQIISFVEEQYEPGRIGPNGEVDGVIRNSQMAFIEPTPQNQFVFRRLTDVVVELNERYFRFDLYGFMEGLQISRYDGSQHYSWHIDSGIAPRKLSLSVQLSDPDDYEGGDVELMLSQDPTAVSRGQGNLALFPSYTVHRVTPVTKGTRYSLVGWLAGPAFR